MSSRTALAQPAAVFWTSVVPQAENRAELLRRQGVTAEDAIGEIEGRLAAVVARLDGAGSDDSWAWLALACGLRTLTVSCAALAAHLHGERRWNPESVALHADVYDLVGVVIDDIHETDDTSIHDLVVLAGAELAEAHDSATAARRARERRRPPRGAHGHLLHDVDCEQADDDTADGILAACCYAAAAFARTLRS